MLDSNMREKIFLALKDKKNGSIHAIYARIRKYGTPFKTTDKRRKLSFEYPEDARVSQSVYINRIKHGWDPEKAKNTPAGKQGKRHDKDTRETVSNAVLAS